MPLKDPEAKRQYMRVWRAKNPDKVTANSRRRADAQRAYRIANLGQYAEYQRKSRARNPREHLVYQARARARRDDLPCNITVEALTWPTHCPILGIELCYEKTPTALRRKEWQVRHGVATLDRRVNELGYVAGNVFVISHRANRIKSDATADELAKVAAYAAGG